MMICVHIYIYVHTHSTCTCWDIHISYEQQTTSTKFGMKRLVYEIITLQELDVSPDEDRCPWVVVGENGGSPLGHQAGFTWKARGIQRDRLLKRRNFGSRCSVPHVLEQLQGPTACSRAMGQVQSQGMTGSPGSGSSDTMGPFCRGFLWQVPSINGFLKWPLIFGIPGVSL